MRHVALVLFFGPLLVLAQPAKPQEVSSIEGRVLNAANGEPVGKANLLLVRTGSTQDSEDWTRNYAASSDSAGRFSIRNIDPGRYRLRASRSGFVAVEYGARGSRQSGTLLDLDHPEELKDLDLRLTPHGVIAGRVVDADGEPLSGAQVQLLRTQYVNGRKVLATKSPAYTNDLGEYRFAGLIPGRYYIYAENLEALPPNSAVKEDYVPVYYPGVTESAAASPFDVTAGAQLRAGDIMLRKSPTAAVRGRVVVELPGAHGTPSVRFFPRVGHDNSAASTFRTPVAKVNAAGEFEIRSLPPGSYTVGAEVSRGGRSHLGSTRIDVAGADIDGMVLTVGRGLTITGRIRVDGGTPPDLQKAHLRVRRGGPTVDSVLFGWTYPIAQDRTFTIEDLEPGRYGVLVAGLPDGYYTKSIRMGETDVTYSGVDLTSGAPAEIEILVRPKAGLISGMVQAPNEGPAAAGATVLLIPKEKERVPIPAFYYQATADQHGRFTLKNLAPGEYKLYAWEDVEATAWMDPDFMKPFEAKGESVTVAEGTRTNLQVSLISAEDPPK